MLDKYCLKIVSAYDEGQCCVIYCLLFVCLLKHWQKLRWVKNEDGPLWPDASVFLGTTVGDGDLFFVCPLAITLMAPIVTCTMCSMVS